MSVPDQINDGDWRKPNFETVDIRYPFSERGDGESYEFTPTFTVDKKSYRRPTIGSELDLRDYNLKGYLVNLGSPKDIGDGLFRVTQTYASVPMNREEDTTIALTIPVLYRSATDGVTTVTLESFSRTFSGYNQFEYSLNKFDPEIAFSMFVIGRRLFIYGGKKPGEYSLPSGGPYLSQDSEVGIYKGRIYYRKSTYARIPSSGAIAN